MGFGFFFFRSADLHVPWLGGPHKAGAHQRGLPSKNILFGSLKLCSKEYVCLDFDLVYSKMPGLLGPVDTLRSVTCGGTHLRKHW